MLSPKKGIVQRAVLDLFKTIAADGLNYEIYASFYEVYIDQVRDLAKLFVEEQSKQRSLFFDF